MLLWIGLIECEWFVNLNDFVSLAALLVYMKYLRKITPDELVRCSVIMSNLNAKLARHFQNLVGHWPVTDCYFQHPYPVLTFVFCSL